MTLLVLDGPLQSGKSTLAKALGVEWRASHPGGGFAIRSMPWEPGQTLERYVEPMERDLKLAAAYPDLLIVWEGSWLSHLVYSAIIDDSPKSVQLRDKIKSFEKSICSFGHQLILVHVPVSVLSYRRAQGPQGPSLPIGPSAELGAFFRMARGGRWRLVKGDSDVSLLAPKIVHKAARSNP